MFVLKSFNLVIASQIQYLPQFETKAALSLALTSVAISIIIAYMPVFQDFLKEIPDKAFLIYVITIRMSLNKAKISIQNFWYKFGIPELKKKEKNPEMHVCMR